MTWLFRILKQMSPQIVKALQEGLDELFDKLAEKAKETENKWDDWGVEMMRKILKVE